MRSHGHLSSRHPNVVFWNKKIIITLALFGALVFFVVTWMLWSYLTEDPKYLWSYLLFVPVLIPLLLYARSRVIVTDADVVVVNPYRSIRIPFEAVRTVVPGRAVGWGMTGYLERTDGERIRLFAFECGRGWACVDMKQNIERLNRLIASRRDMNDSESGQFL